MDAVVAGTPVAFKDRLQVSEGRLSGQLDNVLTAAALVYLFETGFQGTAFFTAQEEAGRSWRYLLEWFRRFGGSTNRLFVVDTSPFPSVEEADRQLLVLRERDANASFNQDATELVDSFCRQNNLSFLYKNRYVEADNEQRRAVGKNPRSLGSTEMGRIIAASGGLVDGTTLQIPTSGYHTMAEVASCESVAAFISMLTILSQESQSSP